MLTGICSLPVRRVVWSGPHDKLGQVQASQRCCSVRFPLCHRSLLQTHWYISLWKEIHIFPPLDSKLQPPFCARGLSASVLPNNFLNVIVKSVLGCLTRVLRTAQQSQILRQTGPSVGLILFAIWGLEPFLQAVRHFMFQKEDRRWKESRTHYLMASYIQPITIWIGIILVCRAFDPLVLSTEASQAIKQRFLNFIRSLSTVLAFAYCTASLTQQLQKVMMDNQDSHNTRSVGAQFVGNAVYAAVWVAAVCLFMELLGFSTQKWLTAGGLGTVLLTLAGREIFINFLSSVMIHATRPFVLNEWIQTKIDGYEVSGTVEHVGWWSPTIVRGDDREAVHIPNHKFTVTVVRNLSQKSHWRIKTHFGISHLDVSKIPSIVADMRKVLAKHPQVEQRRLHRRVFLENIDPENQALLILVSCFVKTSHFEEHLRVKEVILLDLLKVISHHNARLATPIRSVQRVYEDLESRGGPFRDVNRSSEAQGRPYMLIEASTITGQRDADQPKVAKEQMGDGTEAAGSTSAEDMRGLSKVKQTQLEGLDSMGLNSKDITLLGAAFEKPPAKIPENLSHSMADGEKHLPKSSSEAVSSNGEKLSSKTGHDQSPQPNKVSKLIDHPSLHKYDKRVMEQGSQSVARKSEKSSAKVSGENERKASEQGPGKGEKSVMTASHEALTILTGDKNIVGDLGDFDQGKRKVDIDLRVDARRAHAQHGSSTSKQENERVASSVSKYHREENLVLGVALDGPKRTLPLDNGMVFPNEGKELVTSGNGNSNSGVKERRDPSQPPGSKPPEGREL